MSLAIRLSRMFRQLATAGLIATCLATHASAVEAPRPAGLPEGARFLKDLPYVENGHRRQKLDLYLPEKPAGPLIVWIHGGGWREGSKAGPPALNAVANGVAIASVEYRFSQDAIFPAQIEDCKAAIRWLKVHAAEYGYREDRIAAWGGSAGGHLVALLGVTSGIKDFDVGANLEKSSSVRCVVDCFGPTDFDAYPAGMKLPVIQKENPKSLLSLLLGGTIAEKPEMARRASPVTWITPDAAPTLIFQGTNDPLVPLDQSERFYKKLREAGVEATLEVIAGGGHGGPEFGTEARIKLLYDFLAKHLAD